MSSKSMTTDRGAEMYKGFFEDMEYVMSLFFKPFENCCGEADKKESEEEHSAAGGLLGPGPMQDIMKCMFDASDIDYDYED